MRKQKHDKQADIVFQEGKFLISGELDFANVMTVYKKSLLQLSKSTALEFDFAALKSSDSAGLALIIEWIKFAKSNNKSIRFTHLPRDLLSIARAAGLSSLISMSMG